MKKSKETVLGKLIALDLKSDENVNIKNEKERENLIHFLMNQCLADPSLKDKEGNDAFSEAK